jgi:thioredoxin reductase
MKTDKPFDVIIIGGSYSGLAAGMALGRALRKILIIDSANPCNKQTPYSHNFITHDGEEPAKIAAYAKKQVKCYKTVEFFNGLAIAGRKMDEGFQIEVESGELFIAKKLIFATGIKDIMPDIPGYLQSWGISVLHCPYCHGYEVKNAKTGILANGDYGFWLSTLISNWTEDLTLYTDGKSTLTSAQSEKLKEHNIPVVETEIKQLEHHNGHVRQILFKDGSAARITVLYARSAFIQHSDIPELLGCELNEDGYIRVDPSQKTTIAGVYACGDNSTRMRTLANAVATGTTAGMMVNKELTEQEF